MQVAKKIGILFIVSMLILATGGFSVYHHICHCAGENSYSVFLEADCEHQGGSTSCCSSEGLPTCCQEISKHGKNHSCHDDNCCQDNSQFFKINDSFQPGLYKISFKPVVVLAAVLFAELSLELASSAVPNIICSDLPPPDSGKEILTALHQLKLDTHLV